MKRITGIIIICLLFFSCENEIKEPEKKESIDPDIKTIHNLFTALCDIGNGLVTVNLKEAVPKLTEFWELFKC